MSFLPNTRVADSAALPLEIAFLLAEGVEASLLGRAVALARASGTDAATALLNAGLIAEEDYYRALARSIGAPFLEGPMPFGPGLRVPDCLVVGMAPLVTGALAPCVLAPRGREIAEFLSGVGPAHRMPAITTPTRLRQAVFAARSETIARHAAEDLRTWAPNWAVAREPMTRWALFLGLCLCTGVALFSALPASVALGLTVAAQILFLAMATLRLGALLIPVPVTPSADAPVLRDRDLPVYTVLVALHREARVVPRLVKALAGLDYPTAKLDLKFVIEADDHETAAALARVPFPARFEVITAPRGAPRTKPRALNVALPLARGSHLVVFDAEDVPEPGQLRRAAALFAQGPDNLACLQGRLVIDNPGDSLLARLFALEYAALFDVVNPALAACELPVPLGGTSTHFRTRVLRELHGWDAWNVTEDCDLGMRLALTGYQVGDLPCATLEEAPIRIGSWLRQRTRWMKGFLQTSLTHGRQPIANLARLGWLEGLCAVTMVPGTVLSALVYPVCLLVALARFGFGESETWPDLVANVPLGLALTLFATGGVALTLPAALGCWRRGWRDLLWYVPLLPFYFGLVSLAAWLALFELIHAPDRWNKTEHGLSRSSRSGRLTRCRQNPF